MKADQSAWFAEHERLLNNVVDLVYRRGQRWMSDEEGSFTLQRMAQAALLAHASARPTTEKERIVEVSEEGVQFGNAWFSHERITGYTAEQLNGGESIIGNAYLRWLSGEVLAEAALVPATAQTIAADDARAVPLPRSDSWQAKDMIEAVLKERNYPSASIQAGRAGYEAAYRALAAPQDAPDAKDAPEGWTMPDAKDVFAFINRQPLVASLLYDINLLPEQITNPRHWNYMLAVCEHMAAALAAPTPKADKAPEA